MMKILTFRKFAGSAGTKLVMLLLLGACLGVVLSGCHSGTMRGVGSDVEKLGQEMQE